MRADFGSLALADIFNEAIHCCSIDVMLCVLPKAKRETDAVVFGHELLGLRKSGKIYPGFLKFIGHILSL